MIDTTQTQRDKHVQGILTRCEHVGLIALALRPDGTAVGTRGAGEVLVAHPEASALCSEACMHATADEQGEIATIAPGVLATTLSLHDEGGVYASIVVLFPHAIALANGGSMKLWLGDSLPPHTPSWDPNSAKATARSLLHWSQDICALAHAEVDTHTFTQQLTNAFDTIDVMYQLGRSMKQPSLPEQFLRSTCERVRKTLNFGWMAAQFAHGTHVPKSLRSRMFSNGTLPANDAVLSAHLVDFVANDGPTAGPASGLGELACGQVTFHTLDHKGMRVGVLVVGGKFGEDPDVSSYDTQLLEATSGFLGSFIDNVALYDDQDDLFVGTVQAMTAAIDAKDSYTCGHSERVALLSAMIAQAAGLSPDECNDARIGGLVHDVGKIGVPEAVLCKPGKLTDEEFDHIKKHPEIGHRILRGVKLLTRVLPGVLYHHERWDGRGYPHRLVAEQIPMLARVIAVADTFDAMSSDRSYRKKLDRSKVLEEIARSGGSQLDPVLAPLILKIDLSAYDAMAQQHAKTHTASPATPCVSAKAA